MLHVVNTRPGDRALGLTTVLQQTGYQVSSLPLLELIAEPFDDQLQQQLIQIRMTDIVVVVSPTAVELGLTYLQQLNIELASLTCQWVAVGQGTAEMLQQAGIFPQVPAIETSEGMLALDVFQVSGQPVTIMFWRGHGGRTLMLQTLQAQQQHTMSVNLYRRQLPAASKQQYISLLQNLPDVLLISSGASWQHWLQLGTEHGPLIPPYILVLGERVQQLVKNDVQRLQANSQIILLSDLQPDSILQALQQLQKCL
ncbi:uroporphyrinogen-III synthase [Alkanindiges sp. WGS2144]|uniref:uroporphyrinogen-III synthase n=1 Tax=Alkanindiges sp. WGS2144 TaxID=3366808 RepID=UPI0037524507